MQQYGSDHTSAASLLQYTPPCAECKLICSCVWGLLQGVKVNSKGKEVAHGARLYSIASTRYGDEFDGQTASLCVRRATYWDPDQGKEDDSKKGLCSNFL